MGIMQVFLGNGPVTDEHADEEADDPESRGIPVEYTARRKRFFNSTGGKDTSLKKKKIKAQKLLKLQETLGSLERSHSLNDTLILHEIQTRTDQIVKK